MSDTPAVRAGWYLDPDQPAFQRYWDGVQWTTHMAPAPATAPPVAPSPVFDPYASTPAPTTGAQPPHTFMPQGQQVAPDPGGPAYTGDYWAPNPAAPRWSPPTVTAAPSAPRRRIGKGGIAAIILVAIALAIGGSLLLNSMAGDGDESAGGDTSGESAADGDSPSGAGVVEAITGNGEAAYTEARADVHTLGIEIMTYVVDYMEAPTVTADGGYYVISGADGEYARMPIAEGVEFGGWSATSAEDWCVWVTAAAGDVKDYQISSGETSGPGNCS